MTDALEALIALSSSTQISMLKTDVALPSTQKKDASEVHAPEIKSGGFTRLFPNFYELNNKNVADPKDRKKLLKHKATFTRSVQLPGQGKTEIYTTPEVYFIPLDFKSRRMFYEGAYDPGAKKPPDCQSENSIIPATNKYANSCGECEYSKWEGSKPPACGELPEILALDLTSNKVDDPEVKAQMTREAVTIGLGKSAIKAVEKLKKELTEPVLFDDGSYGPIDMTQYIIKMTANPLYDEKGQELTYCDVEFKPVGRVPFEVSEQLLEMLNAERPGGKTVREMFIGRLEPHVGPVQGVAKEPLSEEVKAKASPPVAKVAQPTVKQEVAKPAVVEAPSPAPEPAPSKEVDLFADTPASEQTIVMEPPVKGAAKTSVVEQVVAEVAQNTPAPVAPSNNDDGLIIF